MINETDDMITFICVDCGNEFRKPYKFGPRFKYCDNCKKPRFLKNVYSYRKTTKQKIKGLLGNKCMVCGFKLTLDLHHKDGLRPSEMNGSHVSSNSKKGLALHRWREYLLLCPNHHRLLHEGFITNQQILDKEVQEKYRSVV